MVQKGAIPAHIPTHAIVGRIDKIGQERADKQHSQQTDEGDPAALPQKERCEQERRGFEGGSQSGQYAGGLRSRRAQGVHGQESAEENKQVMTLVFQHRQDMPSR